MTIGFAMGEAPSPPTIFLSSTYYDLRSERQELESFLSDLGYIPILFENVAALPRVPAPLSAIRHAGQADLCVLIIGERYGSIDANQLVSWTQQEFRTARDLGRPIFVFCLDNVLAKYELFRSRPKKDLWEREEVSLFKFIEEVSGFSSRFSFSGLKDLKETLRAQLAGYFGYLIRRYSSLEEVAPRTASAWCQIARREAKKAEFGKAVFCYRQAIDLDSDNKTALFGLALNLWRMARFEEAEDIARQGIAKYAHEARFQGVLCQILRDAGRLCEALAEAKKLTDDYPQDDRAWGTLSVIYDRLGDSEKAAAAAREAYEIGGKSNRRRFYRLLALDPWASRDARDGMAHSDDGEISEGQNEFD